MDAPQLTGSSRRRLAALLADQRLQGLRLLTRLRELRSLEGLPTCSAMIHLLTHLRLPEAEAEELVLELLRHREELRSRLARDPGMAVATIDYLSNVSRLLRNPAVVELEQLEETERNAITDPLTELYNRRYFQSALDTEIRRSQRYGLKLALVLLDLDSFKSVNDVYGHPFGDCVLRRAGQVIRRAVRESDTACRFGGEEFAVILPETDRLGGRTVANRVRRRIEQEFAEAPIEGRLVTMTISGGVACYPADGHAPDQLVDRADRALYQSKARGRNRVVMHHDEKRRSVRYPPRHPAMTRLTVPARGATAAVRALDLSREGMLLETQETLGPTDVVEVTLESTDEPLVVRGHVVRSEPAGDGQGQRRVAVVFDEPLADESLKPRVASGRRPSRGKRA